MTKKKYIFALILSAILCFTIVGCGTDEKEEIKEVDPIVGSYTEVLTLNLSTGSYIETDTTIVFHENGDMEMDVDGTHYTGTWQKTEIVDKSIDGIDRTGYELLQKGEVLIKVWFAQNSEDEQVPYELVMDLESAYVFCGKDSASTTQP